MDNYEFKDMNEILLKSWNTLDSYIVDILETKVNYRTLLKCYKLPLEFVSRYQYKFRFRDILKYQILTTEELIILFKMYNIKVNDVECYLGEIYSYQLATIDNDTIDRVKMLLELTGDIS